MTLDEAIKKEEGIAEEKFNNAVYIMDKMKSDIALENAEEYKRCAEEHRQLAEWLTDYKRLLEQEPRKGYLSIDDVMSVFDDFMCGEVDEDGTTTFLEMLKDTSESEVEDGNDA